MMAKDKTITLEHGNGGRSSHQLVNDVFLPVFDNRHLSALLDSAVLENEEGRLALTTDSYVIRPVFFPGGDIGKIAVAGTVNDLAVCGAQPRYLSAGFIIEEGFALTDLKTIVGSMQKTAEDAGVTVVTGDTKVVPAGQADGLFINTSGIGFIDGRHTLSPLAMRPGDKIILSGTVGDHAAAIMKARGDFPIEFSVESDCAPLWPLIRVLLERVPAAALKVMRDPTRGGLATTLVELSGAARLSIEIEEKDIPIRDQVRAICELTGFDPLYLANEGKVVVVCAPDYAETVMEIMTHQELGVKAADIGTVTDDPLCRVFMKTRAGGTRVVDMLVADMLPRIC
jgi:hydrogenase expression/formation protein HypE